MSTYTTPGGLRVTTEEITLVTTPVTMTTTRHGDDEAHRTGCADLTRGRHRGSHRVHDLGHFASRTDLAADWFSDMIAEDADATPAYYVGAIHFAPCLDALPMGVLG